MITVLVSYERISLFHTMEPFFSKKFRKLFHFTQSPEYCLTKDKNSVLFMERCFQHREPRDLASDELSLIKKLRDKYKTIVFLNGQPEAGTNRLDLLPYVDRLFYKSVFSDPGNYTKDLYAKNLFADYYHKKFNISDKDTEYRYKPVVSIGDIKRIELSWNIGVGNYPRKNWPQRAGVVLARSGFPGLRQFFKTKLKKRPSDFSDPARPIAVHARIDPVSCESIAYQRRLYIEKSATNKLFLTGIVPQNQYYQELKKSKMTLSPFGWGEVCFRDFEAIISGSLLLKPDMSHLKTWPDVYIPYETYIPTNWDGTDLIEKAEAYLSNDQERKRIAENAWEQYRSQLAGLDDRFISIFHDIL
ncbi:glycosyltransferase [Leadbettera azotonutricia]|uniref:Spore protein YkvP/CgeB glycosyl transferase-like domain-containing protein n=1 Tax=Leadbettera azotonutricia (strain ATCC BAA-888 / DSM 13862 / ZAS-9) TaxID=545695 RepID=F5YAU4_LEAAZ|nr:glycosyltransferase [Leadbettera azotonutricia]AEF83237.1 conserved hypothetical protein [Leadbettera azotonutricia ZAS-9]